MSFRDRTDAGRRLAPLLMPYAGGKPVIVALPRGGVPVAAEVAAALDAPLDIIIVRKVGLPQQPELAAAAVVDTDPPALVRNDDVIRAAGLSAAALDRLVSLELVEMQRRRRIYQKDRRHVPLRGRTVILVDDGIATGATVRAALKTIRSAGPGKIVLAVPVGPADTIADLRREADDVVCIEEDDRFDAVGSYYADFPQLDDDEVTRLLDEAAARTGSLPPPG